MSVADGSHKLERKNQVCLLEFWLPQLGTKSWRAGGSLAGSSHMQ